MYNNITPYLDLINYPTNDYSQYTYLGGDVNSIQQNTLGLKKQSHAEKVNSYLNDIKTLSNEFHRILKPNKGCIIVIGDTNNGLVQEKIIKIFEKSNDWRLYSVLKKPIVGIKNSMRNENILFLRKVF